MRIVRGPVGREGADDDIGAVSRRDDQASVLQMIEKVRQLHGADLDVRDLSVQPLRIPADQLCTEGTGDLAHRRSFQERLFR